MNQIKLTTLPNSEVEIEGEIPAEQFAGHRPAALNTLSQSVKIDGFRAGHIPEKVLLDRVGEETVLQEMAEQALSDLYPEIIREHKIDALGRPAITITKLAKDNPLGFKIRTAVHPEFELPDYKKIARDLNAEPAELSTVEDKEVDEVIEEIRKSRADKTTGALPELSDDFVKTLGSFDNAADLKAKIKENLTHEKEHKARDKRRVKLLDALAAAVTVSLPPVLIESETAKMVAELRAQIEGMRLQFADYLTHLKKSEEDLRNDWRPDAEKRVKTSLLLSKIAAAEQVTPNDEEVTKEVAHLKQHYPDADDLRLKIYVVGSLTNEKTIQFLENLR